MLRHLMIQGRGKDNNNKLMSLRIDAESEED